MCSQLTDCSIIQDCEDALTNWVEQNAAVDSKLSARARNLSQRRKNRNQGEGINLAGQDQEMQNRESGLWIPASQHQQQGDEYEEEEDEEEGHEAANGEARGRDVEEREAATA